MNYRLIRSTKNASGKHPLLLPLFLLALVLIVHLLFPRILPGTFAYITSPLWKAEQLVFSAGRQVSGFFSSKESLITEVTALRDEVERKDIQLLDRDALADENRLLKETFGRYTERSGILAGVLSTPPRSLYDSIAVDAGSAEGVHEGSLVFVGPVALGTIVRVTPHTSVAKLFSTAGEKTAMRISHAGTSIPVDAEGLGGGGFMVVLPKEVSVAVGDNVLLPGSTPVLFGKVEGVDSALTGSFQTVYISSPVVIGNLRFVEIKAGTAGY